MSSYLPSIDFLVGGVIVGLILAGVNAFFKRRKLYIVVPKLFSHSELSSSGQVIELNVRNKGKRTEEDIRVALNPKLSYEVIASTLPSLALSKGGVIHIQRLSKSEEVSIVLTAEKGEFVQDSVLSISSKDTKGEIKKETQDTEEETVAGILMALSFIFIVMPAAGYFVGNYIRQEISESPEVRIDPYQEIKNSLAEEGWRDVDGFIESGSFLGHDGVWPIEVEFPQRKGDLLVFTVKIKNETEEVIEAAISTTTAFDDGRFFSKNGYWPDDSVLGFLIPKGTEARKQIETYLPYESEQKVVRFDFSIKTSHGTFRPSYTWTFQTE